MESNPALSRSQVGAHQAFLFEFAGPKATMDDVKGKTNQKVYEIFKKAKSLADFNNRIESAGMNTELKNKALCSGAKYFALAHGDPGNTGHPPLPPRIERSAKQSFPAPGQKRPDPFTPNQPDRSISPQIFMNQQDLFTPMPLNSAPSFDHGPSFSSSDQAKALGQNVLKQYTAGMIGHFLKNSEIKNGKLNLTFLVPNKTFSTDAIRNAFDIKLHAGIEVYAIKGGTDVEHTFMTCSISLEKLKNLKRPENEQPPTIISGLNRLAPGLKWFETDHGFNFLTEEPMNRIKETCSNLPTIQLAYSTKPGAGSGRSAPIVTGFISYEDAVAVIKG